MKVIGLLVGVFAMVIGGGSSWADGSIKDAPAPVAAGCVGQFSGYYVGGQVGYLEHDTKFHDELGTGYISGDDSGVTFGIYSGYNRQCGRLLYGIESDFNYADSDASLFDDCCDQINSSDMKWFSTVRARLGIVHQDNILFYVTGGLAYANLDYTFAVGDLDFYQKDDDTKFGYAVGGGVEFLRHANWSLKAEALYVDLGKEKVDYEDALCGIDCTARIGYEDDFWTARIGLSYHFGRREEVVPLK